MFCTKCGNPMPDGSKFCTQCGALLEVPETVNEAVQEATASVEEALEAVLTPVEAPVQEALSPVEEAIKGTQAGLEEAAPAATEAVEEAAAAVEAPVEEAAAAVEETVQAAETAVEETVETAQTDVEETVQEAASAATEAVEETAAAVEAPVKNFFQPAADIEAQNPFAAAPAPEAIVASAAPAPAEEAPAPAVTFCTNCGAAIPEGFAFCTQCGTKVGGAAEAEAPALDPVPVAFAPVTPVEEPAIAPMPAAPAAEPVPAPAAEETKAEKKAREKAEKEAAAQAEKQAKAEAKAAKKAAKKGGFFKKFILFLIILILIVAAAAAGFWFYLRQPKTFNVENYVSVEFSGYQSNGTAKAVLDKEAMTQEIKDAMSLRLQVADLLGSFANKVGLDVDFDKCMEAITLTTDKTTGLNNGDEVNVSITYDNEALKGFGVNYTGEAVKAKAEKLSDLNAIDPFEGLSVIFNGVNGEGYLEFAYEAKYSCVKQDNLVFDKMNGLSNGDVITVTLNITSDDVRPAGYELAKTSATYTVADLVDYITGPSKEVDTFIENAKRSTDPIVKAYVEEYKEKYDVDVQQVSHFGYILAVHEDGLKTKLYSVYRGQRIEEDQIAMVYMPVAFKTLIISEGSVVAEATDAVWTDHEGVYEMCSPLAMIEAMTKGGYTLYYGGQIAEFEGMKDITDFAEITDDDIENISYEAMNLIVNARDKQGLTDKYNIDETSYYGGYLFFNKKTKESILVMITEATVSSANGASYTAYFPTMYINPMHEKDGQFVIVAENTDVPGMTNVNSNPGFKDINDLNELIVGSFDNGEVDITMSENLEALLNGEVPEGGEPDVDPEVDPEDDQAAAIANSVGGQMASAPYTNIEEYFHDDAIVEYYNDIIDTTIENSNGMFVGVEFTADTNDVYVNYFIASDFAEEASANLANADLDALALQSIASIQEECGIQPTSLTFRYLDENGELLASGTAEAE